MALDTYANLQTSIASWLNRTDLTATVPDFIALCEGRLRRVLQSKETTIYEATLVSGDTSISLPADLTRVISVAISGSTLGSALVLTNYAAILEQRVVYTTASIPKFCAVVNDALELAPAADADYTIAIEVEGPFVPLSVAAPSNWILTDYPDVYLYGTLAESAPYLKDDARIPVWDGRFRIALAELEMARDRWRFPAGTSYPIPSTFGDTVAGY